MTDEEEDKLDVSKFDSNDLDDALFGHGLDWTFDKPPDTTKFLTIYITKKEEHEYEIEYGNMLDEDTYGEESTECFSSSKESAIDRFKELVAGDKYDQVDLVERYNVIDGCCESSDVIMEHRKEHPSYLQ